MAETVPFKYRAFLSYSHKDTAWAKWLHARLEGFRIDKDLIGRETHGRAVATNTEADLPRSRRFLWRPYADGCDGQSARCLSGAHRNRLTGCGLEARR